MAISETREQRLAREAAEQIAADAKRKEQEKASYLEIAKKPGMQAYLTKFATAYKKAFETGDFSGLQTVINEQVNNKGGLFEFGRRDHNGPPTYDTAFEGLLNMATKMGEYGITPPLTKTVQADKYASIYKDIYKKASDRTVSSPLGRLQMELNAVKKYKENEEIVKKSAPPNLNNLNELSGKTFSKLTSGGRVDSITFIPNSLGYKDYYKYQLQGTGEWRFGKQVPSNAVPGTGSYIGRDYSVYYKDEKGETRSMPIDNLSTFGITVNALPKDYIDYTKSTKGNVSSLSNIWNGDIGDVNASPKKAGPSSYETADGKSIGKFDAGYDQYDKYVKGLEAAGINYKGESISGAPLTPEQQAYLAKNKPAHYGVFINNLGQQVTATSLEMLKNMTALGFPQVEAPTSIMNATQQAELAAVAPGIPRTDLQPIVDKLIAAQPKTLKIGQLQYLKDSNGLLQAVPWAGNTPSGFTEISKDEFIKAVQQQIADIDNPAIRNKITDKAYLQGLIAKAQGDTGQVQSGWENKALDASGVLINTDAAAKTAEYEALVQQGLMKKVPVGNGYGYVPMAISYKPIDIDGEIEKVLSPKALELYKGLRSGIIGGWAVEAYKNPEIQAMLKKYGVTDVPSLSTVIEKRMPRVGIITTEQLKNIDPNKLPNFGGLLTDSKNRSLISQSTPEGAMMREKYLLNLRAGLERNGVQDVIRKLNEMPQLFTPETITNYTTFAQDPLKYPVDTTRPVGQSGAVLEQPLFGGGTDTGTAPADWKAQLVKAGGIAPSDTSTSSIKSPTYQVATQTTQPVNTTTQTNPLATVIAEKVPTNQNPTLASTMTQIAGVTSPTPRTNTGDSSSLLSVDEIKRITATIAKPYESPSLASTLSEIKAPTIKPVSAPQTSYASSGQSTPITPGEPLKRAIIRSKRVNSINPLAKRGGSPRLKTKLNYA